MQSECFIVTQSISIYFYNEFYTTNASWGHYICAKNLGVMYRDDLSGWGIEVYEIVDQKKWLVSKLKYGL